MHRGAITVFCVEGEVLNDVVHFLDGFVGAEPRRVGLWVSGVFIGVSSVGDVDAGVEPGFFDELFKRGLDDQGVE